MPRIARKFYKGQFYHVIVQGIEKKFIFDKKIYKEKYIQLIKYYFNELNIAIISYCIMDNHTHILVHLNNIEQLSKAMQKINSVYAMYYNKEEKRVGYVYKERFKSQEILNQYHLYNCIVYIHQNPVKANMVQKAEKYLYSSCNDYIKKTGVFNRNLENILKEIGISANMNFTRRINIIKDIDFLEIEEDRNNLYDALIQNNFSLADLLQNKEKINKVIFYLRDNKNISLRDIADNLKIGRETVRKIYNNKN